VFTERLALLALCAGAYVRPCVALAQAAHPEGPRPPGAQWNVHSWSRPRPPVVDPGPERPAPPPSDAIVLFDGHDLSQWQMQRDSSDARWIVRGGYMEVAPGSGGLMTRRAFGDIQLHLEYSCPNPPHGESQERGNSGVFLMTHYEVQVLDSYQNDTYPDGQAGAIYGQTPPLVNPVRPPGQWNAYDIVFHRPRFSPDGAVLQPARITVLLNGVLIQDNTTITGWTVHMQIARYRPHADRLPLALQDHENPTRFRNVWVRELPE
jgi:hypothetical protein